MVSRPGIGSQTTRTPFSRVWRVAVIWVFSPPPHNGGGGRAADGGGVRRRRGRRPLRHDAYSHRATSPAARVRRGSERSRARRGEHPHERLHRFGVGGQAIELFGLLRQVRGGARRGGGDAGGGQHGFGELGRVGGGQHHD